MYVSQAAHKICKKQKTKTVLLMKYENTISKKKKEKKEEKVSLKWV